MVQNRHFNSYIAYVMAILTLLYLLPWPFGVLVPKDAYVIHKYGK